jgi:hypothetical protein
MKATTLRFGEDLWALLEDEAARSGVSVSQYVREAALARAAFAAGSRADVPAGILTGWARRAMDGSGGDDEKRRSADRLVAALQRAQDRREWDAAHERRIQRGEEAAALQAQARQTARRARELREASRGPE